MPARAQPIRDVRMDVLVSEEAHAGSGENALFEMKHRGGVKHCRAKMIGGKLGMATKKLGLTHSMTEFSQYVFDRNARAFERWLARHHASRFFDVVLPFHCKPPFYCT